MDLASRGALFDLLVRENEAGKRGVPKEKLAVDATLQREFDVPDFTRLKSDLLVHLQSLNVECTLHRIKKPILISASISHQSNFLDVALSDFQAVREDSPAAAQGSRPEGSPRVGPFRPPCAEAKLRRAALAGA